MRLLLDSRSQSDYAKFLKIKTLPRFKFTGRMAEFPDEYATALGIHIDATPLDEYSPPAWMFDYQRDISKLAIRKQKLALFVDCGLGKTAIAFEFAKYAVAHLEVPRCVLIISPLMVIPQTMAEAKWFYGDELPIVQVAAKDLPEWLASGTDRIGITNYEALTNEVDPGRLGALILDESSLLKSHYGKWGQRILSLGKGLAWKLCLTGTPAPNDRIEYANHAVFLDQFPTVNSFLARFFVNRGQTGERWELKHHAMDAFYRQLSYWSIFLTNPATYGWKDNAQGIPPIVTHVHEVGMTAQQTDLVMDQTGALFAGNPGGITSRSTLAQIAKGNFRGEDVETRKYSFIRDLVATWPDESTLIWCKYNAEQDRIAAEFPDAANISGDTPHDERMHLIDDFKAGRRKILISKAKILGFGLNLQVCSRMIFSGLQDSYEEYYQCVKRANRIGSKRALNVHIPVTDIERPMIETVLLKAARVQRDADEQERIFHASITR